MSIREVILLVLVVIVIVLANMLHSGAYKRRMKLEENKVLLIYGILEEIRNGRADVNNDGIDNSDTNRDTNTTRANKERPNGAE